MPPPQKKKDIADFFKPHARNLVPQKRPSPSSTSSSHVAPEQRHTPRTPVRKVKFKDVAPESVKPPYCSPVSQSSLPIRSPRPTDTTIGPVKLRQSSAFETPKAPEHGDGATGFNVNTSFTFSDASERSQKVIQDGKLVAVKDSDDDTDSLESLGDIFGKNRDAAATSDSSPPEEAEAERIKTLGMFTFGRSAPIVSKEKLRALQVKEKAAKFDLSAVLDDHFDDEEAEQNILRMRAGFDDTPDQQHRGHFDKDLLASVVRSGDADTEDVDRLLNAVERTEALSSERVFSFFLSRSSPKGRRRTPDRLPKQAIPHELWSPKDIRAQDRAYLSGYMAELAHDGDLADEVLEWTFGRVIKEPRPELRYAYIRCLEAGSNTWTRLNVTATDVQALFQDLDADPDCLRDASPVKATHLVIQPKAKQHRDFLLSVLQMFRAICADMDFPALSKLCSIILRIVLDSLVMSEARICIAVEHLIGALLSLPDEEMRSHVYDRFLSDATEHITDSQLQVRLLNHLLPMTDDATVLRGTLAKIFLLGPKVVGVNTETSNARLDDLTNHLATNPSFSTTRHADSSPVDYTALASLTQILDIAISSGTPPSTIIPYPALTQHQPDTSLPLKLIPKETQFNAQVDELADKVHALFVSIKDTGASHMRRTEAKDVLQALYFRLLFSVRTRPRRKKHVFDPNGGRGSNGRASASASRWVTGEEWRERERGGEFMKRFLAKVKTKTPVVEDGGGGAGQQD